jgi:hypothetical protein
MTLIATPKIHGRGEEGKRGRGDSDFSPLSKSFTNCSLQRIHP